MTADQLPKVLSLRPDQEMSWGAQLIRPFRAIAPAVWFGARFSDVADRSYMAPDLCLLYLHRRVKDGQFSKQRSRNAFGWFYNTLTGSRFEYVTLTGPIFDTVLKCCGEERLSDTQRSGTYKVRLDIAENLLARMTKSLKKQGILR